MEKQLTMFEMVQEFHRAFNKVKDPEVPTIPSKDITLLRFSLIKEEFIETLEEMGLYLFDKNINVGISDKQIDLTKLAKELADLLYVVLGTAAAYGIPIDDVYREVHRSNMSKLGADGKPVYREDGKVLKGPNYTPADVETVLRRK
jgi:predicted HAD superfamily Cof-like phosphohydrolase